MADAGEVDARSTTLIPLANPKHVKLTCELCGKAAHLVCALCRLTYYCNEEHQLLDALSIHTKICALLVPLRSPATFLGSEQERTRRDADMRRRRIQVLELSQTEAQKLLFESKFNLAIPPALQALRFSMEVYGSESTQVVPNYLLLGEASIGLQQYDQAEDYLSLAKWALLKVKGGEATTSISAHLHRNFGLLYSAKEKHLEATHNFALDIYYSSLLYGPSHISVTGGYFQLGMTFWKQQRFHHTKNAFDKIIDIWNAYIVSNVNNERLNSAQQAECIQMFTSIIEFRAENTYKNNIHAPTADVMFLFAQICQTCIGNLTMAQSFAEQSLQEYQQDNILELVEVTRQFLQNIKDSTESRTTADLLSTSPPIPPSLTDQQLQPPSLTLQEISSENQSDSSQPLPHTTTDHVELSTIPKVFDLEQTKIIDPTTTTTIPEDLTAHAELMPASSEQARMNMGEVI